MLSSGSGLTFTDDDVKKCRVIVGLLSLARFSNVDAAMLKEAHPALFWLEDLLQKIKDNVFDLSKAQIQTPPSPKGKK